MTAASRVHTWLGATFLLASAASLACTTVSVPPATASADPCATSARLFASTTGVQHVEFEVAADRDGLTRIPVLRTQAAAEDFQRQRRLHVRPTDQRIMMNGYVVQSSVPHPQAKCARAPLRFARQDMPFRPGARSVSIEDEFVAPNGTTSVAYSVRLDVHAEQRGRRSQEVIELRRSDSAQRVFHVAPSNAVRLADGAFVIVARSRLEKTTAYDYPAFSVDAVRAQPLRGPIRVAADGSVTRFEASPRIRELVAWGSTRLWAIDASGHHVLGFDVRGDAFFRARTSGRATGLMPHRDGVCVVEGGVRDDRSDHVECFDLRGDRTHEFETPQGVSYVIDAAGRIYLVSKDSIHAFAPDGSVRWTHAGLRFSSNVVASRAMGICAFHTGNTQRELLCYRPSPTVP